MGLWTAQERPEDEEVRMPSDEMVASTLEVRALGGRVGIRPAGSGDVLLAPHEALAIAERLIAAAATAEGQKLLLRDIMSRRPASDRLFRH
jgi:hypothetical protein